MDARLLLTSPNDKWKKAAQFLKDNCPSFIDDLPSKLVEAIRAIEQGTTIRPVCRTCNGRVSFYSGLPARYADFCSAVILPRVFQSMLAGARVEVILRKLPGAPASVLVSKLR